MGLSKLSLSFLQGAVLIVFAPLLMGWLKWWKAWFTGRRRPLTWIIQPYRDCFKLLRLPSTYPQPASWIFRKSPYLIFAAYGSLLFTIPLWTTPLLPADLLLIMYLLGLGRFSLSMAGMDSASSFGHLGSSREMFFHFLTEISFFPALTAFWLWTNEPALLPPHIAATPFAPTTLWPWMIESSINRKKATFWLAAVAILLSFFPILLLEARRLPVGNPATHLELTMAGKAVEIEFSGRSLALVEWGEASKLLFLVALWSQWLIRLFGIYNVLGGLLFLFYPVVWLLAASGLAVWEWRSVKIRLGRVPSVAFHSLALSIFAILLRLISGGYWMCLLK